VERGILTERIGSRDHFMPSSLLDSQLATLELGDDVTVIDNALGAGEVAARIAAGR
jgi:gluconate kinase